MKTVIGAPWFIGGESSSPLQDSIAARQLLLQGWLTAAIFLCAASVAISFLLDGLTAFLFIPLAATLTSLLSIFLIRVKRFELSTWLALLTITGGVLVAVALDPDPNADGGFLIYLAVGNLLAGLLLSWQQMLSYNVLNLLSFLLVPFISTQDGLIELRFTLFYVLILNFVTVLVVWVLSEYRSGHQQQLQASIDTQRHLLEIAYDGVLLIDQQFNVIEVSPVILKQLKCKDVSKLGPLTNIRALAASATPTWQVFDGLQVHPPDGEEYYFEGALQRQGDYTVFALRDITRRKREAQRLTHRNDYLAALHHTALVLMQTQDRENILQMLLGYAAGITGTSDGALIIPSEQQLVIDVGIGLFADVVGQSLTFQDDVAGYVWRTHLPIALDHYDLWEDRDIRFVDWPIKAMVGVPLLARDVFYGIIQLGHTGDRVFSEHDVDALIQFADLAALALHNASLYDDLREYQQRLRAVIENTADAIYIKDLAGRYLLFNPASARIFKARPERILGQVDRNILSPDLYERINPIDQQVMDSGVAYTYEFEQVVDDKPSIFLVTKFPYVSVYGSIDGIVSISRDVTMLKEVERELRRSETYYRSLINNALDIILIVGRDGKFHFYNDSFQRALGYSEQELNQLLAINLVAPSTRDTVRQHFNDLLTGASTNAIECSVVHRDGQHLIFELVAINVTDSEIIDGFIVNARDITPRKAAEKILQRYVTAMEALHDASTRLSQSLNFDRVFETLVVSVSRIFPQMSLAVVHLAGTSELQPYPVRIYDRQAIQNMALVQGISNGLAALPHLRSTHILNIPDIQASETFQLFISSNGALLIVPIELNQVKFGTLSIVSNATNAFDEKDEVLADMLIRQTNVILERVQLFREEQQRRRLSESLRDLSFALNSARTLDELFEHALYYVSQTISNDACNIMLLDPEREYATVRKARGKIPAHVKDVIRSQRFYLTDFDNLNEVVRTRQPVVVPDTKSDPNWHDVNQWWLRSYACAPILNGQEVIGFLNLDSTQPNFFVNLDPAQLMVFANQVGVAIEKIRLIDSEKAQRELSDTLREVSGVLTRPMSREKLLNAFLEQVARVVPYDAAAIWFLDDDKAAYFGYGIGYDRFGVHDVMQTIRHTTHTSQLMKELITSGNVIVVPEIANGDDEWQDDRFGWIKSWAGAPILVQGEYFGKLTLDSTIPGFYNEKHVPLLETLTRQLSIALENVILLEQVQDYATSLELRVQERTVELSRERKQLQTIVSSMDEGVIYLEKQPDTSDLSIRYVNASLCRLLGVGYDGLIGQSLSTILAMIVSEKPTQVLSDLLAKAALQDMPTQQVWRGEFVIRTMDDVERDCSATLTVVASETTHELIWALMVMRDVSQEKALMAQRERFVANASHELRNPLSNLVTRMYLLRNQPDRQDEHIGVMQRTVERLTALAEDLLDITRFNNNRVPMNPRMFDLRRLVLDVAELQMGNAELKRVNLVRDIPDLPVLLWADEKRIYQVVTNLVVNAISYTNERSTVTVNLQEFADHVVLSVEDEGIGIDPKLHGQIFVPFFRASEGKVSGTGLGLAISKEIVERHDGKIWVESDLGKGSRFVVELPKRLPDHR